MLKKSTVFNVASHEVHPNIFCMYGEKGEKVVGRRLMALLVCLAENQGKIVSKEELLSRTWQEVMVSDEALRKSVSDLRQLFGAGKEKIEIESIRGIGYRLNSPVQWRSATAEKRKKRMLAFVVAGVAVLFLVSTFYSPQKVEPDFGPLFSNLSIVRSPRVSKDQSKVVYASSHNGESHLYLYKRQKGVHELIEKSGLERAEAAFSPDGHYITYVARENGVKYLFQKDLDTGTKKILTKLNTTPIQSFLDWSPDGKTIAFSSAQYGSNFRIYFIDQNEEIKEFESGVKGIKKGVIHPRFSPSGNQIAFIHVMRPSPMHNQLIQGKGQVYVKDLQAEKLQLLTEGVTEIGGIEWISETQIAYIIREGFHYYLLQNNLLSNQIDTLYKSEKILRHIEIKNKQLWIEEWDVSHRLMKFQANAFGQKNAVALMDGEERIWQPTFSPDGDRLVYSTIANQKYVLRSLELSTKKFKDILQSDRPIIGTKWSHDSNKLLFTKDDAEPHIVVYDFQTNTEKHITNGYSPSWDTDGMHFYYCQKSENKWEVFRQNISAKNTGIKINGLSAWRTEPYRETLIFCTPRKAGIWQYDPANDTEKLLTDELNKNDLSQWTIQGDEVIYWKRGDNYSPIWLSLNIQTGEKKHLYSHRGFLNYHYSGFAADEKTGTIVYPKQSAFEDEIIQIDLKY